MSNPDLKTSASPSRSEYSSDKRLHVTAPVALLRIIPWRRASLAVEPVQVRQDANSGWTKPSKVRIEDAMTASWIAHAGSVLILKVKRDSGMHKSLGRAGQSRAGFLDKPRM